MKDEKNEVMNEEVDEQVSPITLTDEKGRVYTLEYNRDAVVYAEHRGFVIDDVIKYPVSKIPELFHYAFYMHHKGITRQSTDKLFNDIGKLPDGFVERLLQLYHVPLNTLMSGEGKNGKLTVHF